MLPEPTLRRRLLWAGALLLGAGVAVFVPFLPGGWDIYVHLLWPQQVMRCLSQGQLPYWLPDLNAGFGSPGIRLYSPAGPFLTGVLGLLLGNVERALRLLWFLTLVALVLVARRWHRERPPGWALLWVVSPVVFVTLLYRAASSEFLAMPLALWLLETALAARPATRLEALLWAALWLVHGPTFLMTALLAAAASLAHRPWVHTLARRVLPMLAGLALTAWHWLPFAAEMRWVVFQEEFTGGRFTALSNFLFFPTAHDPAAVRRLEWLSVAWAAGALVSFGTQRLRAGLVLLCIFLATPLSYYLWVLLPPLGYLQFPWRFLSPASVLWPGLAPNRLTARGIATVALFLIPNLWLPQAHLFADPGITVRESWQTLGQKVFEAVSGNPLVVDVPEHRPATYRYLAEHLTRFGPDGLVTAAGEVTVQLWRPLDRQVTTTLPAPGPVDFRLLAYPLWNAWVDGKPVQPDLASGIVRVVVPAGTHRIVVRWGRNPLTAWGWAVAALALGLVFVPSFSRLAPDEPYERPAPPS